MLHALGAPNTKAQLCVPHAVFLRAGSILWKNTETTNHLVINSEEKKKLALSSIYYSVSCQPAGEKQQQKLALQKSKEEAFPRKELNMITC